MADVYFSLGSNLGDKEALLNQAIAYLKKQIGNIVSRSAFYHTAPWGFESENEFLNAAVCCRTSLTPSAILETTQRIEREMGRLHKSAAGHYADRLIDIDMLLYDDLIQQSPTLTLPHPLMHRREFVLLPLQEIAPDVIHPTLHKSIQELLSMLQHPVDIQGDTD